MGYYDSYYLQGVVSVFMVLFGVNFNVYFFLLMKKYAMAWRNTEVRAYFAIIGASTLIITLNILGMFPTAFDAFHHAFSPSRPSLPPRASAQRILTCGPSSAGVFWCC